MGLLLSSSFTRTDITINFYMEERARAGKQELAGVSAITKVGLMHRIIRWQCVEDRHLLFLVLEQLSNLVQGMGNFLFA